MAEDEDDEGGSDTTGQDLLDWLRKMTPEQLSQFVIVHRNFDDVKWAVTIVVGEDHIDCACAFQDD